MSSTRSKTVALALVIAVVLTLVVRSRFGEETFLCSDAECTLGSGTRSMFTGLTLIGPFLAGGGYLWSAWLDGRGRLGPTAKWSVPDFEQILEILAVLAAGLITYWLVLNGPSIESVEVRQVNQWANDLRNFRAEDGVADTNLVPSRFTWFVIGAVLSGPFWFSFGSMLGREILGRRRRKARPATNPELIAGSVESNSTEGEPKEGDADEDGNTINLG